MIQKVFQFNAVWVYNDMGYRNTSLFSPSMYQRIIAPSDKKRNDWIHENEIREKFEAAKPGGGYLYHSDHSIPKDVSFRKYRFVMDCVRKYGQY